MSVKSLKTQLMAAVAMVIVAAVALSSSTYAWFAMNSKVSATGMQVQAKTEGGIEIAYTTSDAASGIYGTSASAGATSASVLAPTSTYNTSAWYHASAESSSSYVARNETYETLTITEEAITGQANGKLGGVRQADASANETNYYMVQTFNIRSTAEASLAKGLTVDKVSVAGSNKDKMDQALRVAVKLGEKVLIYDPVNNNLTPYAVYSGHTGTGASATASLAGNVTCTDRDVPTLIAATPETTIPAKNTGNTTNGGVDVLVYIWFEGEDTELYSENFATNGLIVTIDFSATI